MRLRKLRPEDASLMLEWMHDPDAVAHLQGNFTEKTLEDCKAFISASEQNPEQLHLAITDEDDTYMGTVSLKHINRQRGDAEFAIAIRRCAMGKGFSQFAMQQILQIGFQEMGLQTVFWCVSPENYRAVRFYDKGGYSRTEAADVDALRYYGPNQLKKLLWYRVDA